MAGTVTMSGVASSLNAALECLGDVVRDVIYGTLERNGIGVEDIPLRIPDVVMILRKTVGGGAELIIRKMLAEFRRECLKARTLDERENDCLTGTLDPKSIGMSLAYSIGA